MPSVIRWLDDVKPDVLCMQETKCTDDKFPTLIFQERGYQCQLFGQQTYNGVAILTRDSCDTRHRGYPGDDEQEHERCGDADDDPSRGGAAHEIPRE